MATKKRVRKPAAKAAPRTDPVKDQTLAAMAALEELLGEMGPLFGDRVDLTVLKPGTSVYDLTDVYEKNRTYRIPNDVPFPAAAAFLGAFEDWRSAREKLDESQAEAAEAQDRLNNARGNEQLRRRLARARVSAEKAQAEALKAYGAAWDPLIEAFVGLLAYRHPAVELKEIRDEIGTTSLEQWVATVVARMYLPRMKTLIEETRAAAEASPKAPEAEVSTTPPSSPSSGD